MSEISNKLANRKKELKPFFDPEKIRLNRATKASGPKLPAFLALFFIFFSTGSEIGQAGFKGGEL